MRLVFAFVVMFIVGCSTTGGGPLSLHQETSIAGEVVIGSFYVGGAPITVPIRAWGTGAVTFQWPAIPHLDFRGDGGIEVYIEPANVADSATLQRDVSEGKIRGARLVPHGTMSTWRQK